MTKSPAQNLPSSSPGQAYNIHATCVAIDGSGILIRGKPGSGKSDLALRLIDSGAILVSDDQVMIHTDGTHIYATPPDTLKGLLEIRGIGIVQYKFLKNIPLKIILDLAKPDMITRLPERQTEMLCGQDLPVIPFNPFEVSAVAKIHAILRQNFAK